MNWPPCPQCRGTNIGLAWNTQSQAQLFCRGCKWAWLEALENDNDCIGVHEAAELLDAARMAEG